VLGGKVPPGVNIVPAEGSQPQSLVAPGR